MSTTVKRLKWCTFCEKFTKQIKHNFYNPKLGKQKYECTACNTNYVENTNTNQMV
jgi:transposase-like protein